MQGFLLGLANGTTCLAFCAPVLVPLLLKEGKDVRQNLVTLLKFLGGRLGGYMLFGLLAWATGSLLLQVTRYQSLVIGAAYVGLSVLLLVAVLTFPIIIVMIFGAFGGPLGELFIEVTGLETSANWTGGEVVQTVDHGTYQTRVHRMVFDGLIGERRDGFIQVGWSPPDDLPAHIDEEIDADGDGQADFRIQVDTVKKESTLTPYASWVLELEGTFRIEDELMVRVLLENPAR
jgi:hypothetical protein